MTSPNSKLPRSSGSRTVRVISGRWRGRKLSVLNQQGLRPTGDRVKEMLFSWLTPFIAGSRCLDAFAGTGSLGIECLSRGSDHVTFLETNRHSAKQLQKHLDDLSATPEQANVYQQDALVWLAETRVCFDLIFLDPPFEYDCVSALLASLIQGVHTHDDTLIYLEQPVSRSLDISTLPFEIFKSKKIGQVQCYLLRTKSLPPEK